LVYDLTLTQGGDTLWVGQGAVRKPAFHKGPRLYAPGAAQLVDDLAVALLKRFQPIWRWVRCEVPLSAPSDYVAGLSALVAGKDKAAVERLERVQDASLQPTVDKLVAHLQRHQRARRIMWSRGWRLSISGDLRRLLAA
jgi:hypothetical protein